MTNPTDIEAEARRRLNEACGSSFRYDGTETRQTSYQVEAMCRLLEEYQAFRREVSEAVEVNWRGSNLGPPEFLGRFIIPKPVDLLDRIADDLDITRKTLVETLMQNGAEIRGTQND